MCDGEKADSELIARLFALLTAKFEDSAAVAASYQARDSIADERRAVRPTQQLNDGGGLAVRARRAGSAWFRAGVGF